MAERVLPFELVAAAVVFTILSRRRAAEAADPPDIGRAVWFNLALGALAIALVGPLDAESARALSWHMVQHLLIVSIAAPFLALAHPMELLVGSSPRRFGFQQPVWRGPWVTFVTAFVALSTLLAWHIPVLYQAALSNEAVHIIEHVTLLATSTAVWAALISARHTGASVVWLFVITLPVTAFGVAMTIARTPWYTDYVTKGRSMAVQDQQLAGVIMWAFGGLTAVVGGVVLFNSWLLSASSTSAAAGSVVPTDESLPTC